MQLLLALLSVASASGEKKRPAQTVYLQRVFAPFLVPSGCNAPLPGLLCGGRGRQIKVGVNQVQQVAVDDLVRQRELEGRGPTRGRHFLQQIRCLKVQSLSSVVRLPFHTLSLHLSTLGAEKPTSCFVLSLVTSLLR